MNPGAEASKSQHNSHSPNTPIDLVTVDLSKPAAEQDLPLHNRWHPEIPHVATAKTGQLFRIEAVDWTGGQIGNNDFADDIKNIDLTCVHHLTGPIRIEDSDGKPAQPGDLLVVDIVDIGPLRGHEWGFTGVFAPENGGGFLTDHFPEPAKAIWDFRGRFATSRHIPGVEFAGMIHPGLIGTAPSAELLAIWNKRESALVADGEDSLTLPKHLKTRPLALLPQSEGVLLGKIDKSNENFSRIAAEAARTIPGRENGGNCDIKNLTVGSRLHLPVFVEGANLSYGDLHFSQGDGEVSFCVSFCIPAFQFLTFNLLTTRCSFTNSCKRFSICREL